jgi:hypothetical protein
MKKILASVALALLAGCLLPRPALGDGSCGEAANLTHNCNFDRFVDISEGDSTRVVRRQDTGISPTYSGSL